ncbi:nad synthetase / glutamine amidotransferase chain of nad synthetase [hydrocarbon metagenome]|uniref:NAD(+) synthase (glutamine-hydrolyzing) n=1 Tax=hydrocarbon metagenome TaxID=938273 RepID=A0A0W8E6X1_9ZZZZ
MLIIKAGFTPDAKGLENMKITLAQLNPIVGDIENNLNNLQTAMQMGKRDQSDLLVLPELYLTGYPPQDLLGKPWFIERIIQAIEKIKEYSLGFEQMGILIGTPYPGNLPGKGLFNSALLIQHGQIIAARHKSLLPSYDVFDEARYFDPAVNIEPLPFKEELLGISICEDAWNDPSLWPEKRMYTCDPIQILADKGASIFINISASPFHAGKEDLRYHLIRSHASRHKKVFVYLNQIGGNDELIFDGRSICLDSRGEPLLIFPAFQEHTATLDTQQPSSIPSYRPLDEIESVYQALVLGIRDYLSKCGFNKAILGLSGGIDSALTACLACAAIGAQNVLGISMPAVHSSRGSVEDSRMLAQNLGMEFQVIPITDVHNAYLNSLARQFKDKQPDTTEENLQARIRGNFLMAFSNKFGHLLLSTGNKSEMALGYCTLYGDMSGGLSVLADVPKTMVYELSSFINQDQEIIPAQIILKPPSAELRPGQVDQDDLPPYDTLDKILHYYIEESASVTDLINMGFEADMARWVVETVDRNEYKRRQAAPALKVTSKAFGMGRRMPIAAKIQA